MLEEIGAPYELVKLDLSKQENKAPAYLAVHPFGELPALVDGDVTLFESVAICLYLADRFPEKQLAPPLSSPERGRYYQWMVFAEVTLEPVVHEFHLHALLPEDKKARTTPEEIARREARLGEVLKVLDAELNGRECLVGGHFTAADLVMASILSLILGVLSFALPHTPPSGKAGDALPFLRAFGLLKDPSFAIFFGLSFAITIALAFYYGFAGRVRSHAALYC